MAAGLPAPSMHLESVLIQGPDRESHEWAAGTLRSMLPLTVKLGVATAEEIDIDTLAERLAAETVAHGLVVKTPDLVCARTRRS